MCSGESERLYDVSSPQLSRDLGVQLYGNAGNREILLATTELESSNVKTCLGKSTQTSVHFFIMSLFDVQLSSTKAVIKVTSGSRSR